MPSFLPKPVSPVLQRGDPLARGLVGAWPFFEGAGAAVNELTNNLKGTHQGTPVWAASPFGASLKLSGGSTSDYVSVPSKNLLNPAAISVVAWVNITSLANAYTAIVSKNQGGGIYQLFVKSTGKLACYTVAGSPNIDPGNLTVPTNAWSQLAFTMNAAALTTYVNGAFDTSTTGGVQGANTGALTFGRDLITAGRLLTGSIALVEIYDRALSATEVAQKYQDPFRLYRPRSRLWKYAVQATAAVSAPAGWFDPDLLPQGWFDPELLLEGWFDREQITTIATTAVLLDVPAMLEFLTAVQRNGPAPAENLAQQSRDAPAPLESRASQLRDSGTQAEFIGAQRIDSGIPAESLAGVRANGVAPTEDIASVSIDRPLHSESLGGVAADRPVPLEDLATARSSQSVAAESLASVLADGRLIDEILAGLQRDGGAPVEVLANVRGDGSAPIEWQGAVLVTADGFLQLETSTALAVNTRAALEGLAVVTVDRPIAGEFLLGVLREGSTAVEAIASLRGDSPASLEFSRLVTVDHRAAVELLTGVNADGNVSAEALASVLRDASVPAENIVQTFSVTADGLLLIEWDALTVLIGTIKLLNERFMGPGVTRESLRAPGVTSERLIVPSADDEEFE